MSYGAIQSRVDCNFVKIDEGNLNFSGNNNSSSITRIATGNLIKNNRTFYGGFPQFLIIKVLNFSIKFDKQGANLDYLLGFAGFGIFDNPFIYSNTVNNDISFSDEILLKKGTYINVNGSTERSTGLIEYTLGTGVPSINSGETRSSGMTSLWLINTVKYPDRVVLQKTGGGDFYVVIRGGVGSIFSNFTGNFQWEIWAGSPFQTISDT